MHYCILVMLKVPFQENVNKNHGKKDRAAFFFPFFFFPFFLAQICECNKSMMGLVQGLLKSGSVSQTVTVGCTSGPGELCFLAAARRASPPKISLHLIQMRNWKGFFFHTSEKTVFGTLNVENALSQNFTDSAIYRGKTIGVRHPPLRLIQQDRIVTSHILHCLPSD